MANNGHSGIQAITLLNNSCSSALDATFGGELAGQVLRSYSRLADLEVWARVLANKPEAALHATASTEYLLAILNLTQAQYRNAFKGLRLVFELILQATFVSTNALEMKEWLSGGRYTNWTNIVDPDNGLFSKRMTSAFFDEIKEEAGVYRTISQTVYSELSECIHGNAAKHIPLPTSLLYDADTCGIWLAKNETIQRVMQFSLCLRYLKDFSPEQLAIVEAPVSEQLGHIAAIRTLLGGVTEG